MIRVKLIVQLLCLNLPLFFRVFTFLAMVCHFISILFAFTVSAGGGLRVYACTVRSAGTSHARPLVVSFIGLARGNL